MRRNAGLQARGKAQKPKAELPQKVIVQHQDEDEACPLCCEPMDSTDMEFYPCPCGYQLCMFCFRRLMDEFNKACPGCRQVYDEANATHRKRPPRLQQDTHAQQDVNTPSSSRPSTASSITSNAAASAAPQPLPSRPQASLPPKPPPAPPKRPAEPLTTPRGTPAPEPSPALPTGATWGSTPVARQGSGEAPAPLATAADTAAWPSLADTAPAAAAPAAPPPAAPAPKPPTAAQLRRQDKALLKQQKKEARQAAVAQAAALKQQQQSARAEASAHTQAPAAASQEPFTTPAAGPQQQPRPTRPAPVYTPTTEQLQRYQSAEVSATLGSTSKTFVVPLQSHTPVATIPEAPELLESLKQAVYEGSLSSMQAAQQLVELLAKHNAVAQLLPQRALSASPAPAPVRMRTPPPGFGAAPTSRPTTASSFFSSSGSAFSSPADPSVPAPNRRLQPIGAPSHAPAASGNSSNLGVYSGDAVVSLGGKQLGGLWGEPAGTGRALAAVGRQVKAPPPGFGGLPAARSGFGSGSSLAGGEQASAAGGNGVRSNMLSQQLFPSDPFYSPFG